MLKPTIFSLNLLTFHISTAGRVPPSKALQKLLLTMQKIEIQNKICTRAIYMGEIICFQLAFPDASTDNVALHYRQ